MSGFLDGDSGSVGLALVTVRVVSPVRHPVLLSGILIAFYVLYIIAYFLRSRAATGIAPSGIETAVPIDELRRSIDWLLLLRGLAAGLVFVMHSGGILGHDLTFGNSHSASSTHLSWLGYSTSPSRELFSGGVADIQNLYCRRPMVAAPAVRIDANRRRAPMPTIASYRLAALFRIAKTIAHDFDGRLPGLANPSQTHRSLGLLCWIEAKQPAENKEFERQYGAGVHTLGTFVLTRCLSRQVR